MSQASALARVLSSLPDDARCSITVGAGDLTVAELREALGTPSQFRVLTTGQAAEMLGYSTDTWREWAETKQVVGAYRDDGDSGNWRLPMSACEEHLARLQAGALNRKRKRVPWSRSEGTSAQAEGSRPAGDLERKIRSLRPSPVGRRSADDERPEGPRVA